MTANAFMSVSLEPPLVVVAVDNRAHMTRALPVGHPYGVSILSEQQADLSDHFAGRGGGEPAVAFITRAGVPLLAGAVAHLVARVVEAHPAGDHTLYLGQVEYLDRQDHLPLLFYAGQYERLRPMQPKLAPWPEDEFSLFSLGNFDPSIPEITPKRQP
jgi:flavin reductase (DIM6/NTAB) family NADH-FMN oxidoreductase RutF